MGLSNTTAPNTSNPDLGAVRRMKTQHRATDRSTKDKGSKGIKEVVEEETDVQVSSREMRRGEGDIRVSSRKVMT